MKYSNWVKNMNFYDIFVKLAKHGWWKQKVGQGKARLRARETNQFMPILFLKGRKKKKKKLLSILDHVVNKDLVCGVSVVKETILKVKICISSSVIWRWHSWLETWVVLGFSTSMKDYVSKVHRFRLWIY